MKHKKSISCITRINMSSQPPWLSLCYTPSWICRNDGSLCNMRCYSNSITHSFTLPSSKVHTTKQINDWDENQSSSIANNESDGIRTSSYQLFHRTPPAIMFWGYPWKPNYRRGLHFTYRPLFQVRKHLFQLPHGCVDIGLAVVFRHGT